MEQPRSPLEKFTLPGRILIVAHLLLGIGVPALYIADFIPRMPVGRVPIFLFVVPVGIVCVISFFVPARVLERLGVRIYNP